MRLVTQVDKGVFEVNWTWLPAWLGLNSIVLKELSEYLKPQLEGKALTEDVLDATDALAIDYLVKRFDAIHGLKEHLSSLKQVGYGTT